MQQATFLLPFPPEVARALHGALAPELSEGVPKARASVALDDEGLRVSIEADDLSALRAAVNSYLRWADAAARAAALAK